MNPSDNDIIRRILNGDRQAHAQLIDRHKEKAMTLAVRMLKNRHDAEEALQDAFVRAFRALPSFEGKSSFSTWFYRIVFNVCSSALSRRGKMNVVSFDEESEEGMSIEVPSDGALPDIDLEGKEFSAMIRSEIDAMDEHYSSILTMFFLQEMSYDEIVDVTGLPLGTVKNRLFRARMQLRNALVRNGNDMKDLVTL